MSGLGGEKHFALAFLVGGLVACSGPTGPGATGGGLEDLGCTLDLQYMADGGVGRDGIPTLTDPMLVSPQVSEGIEYLADEDRVIGVVIGGEPVAIPHNILWHHEIVNLNRNGETVAVSFCPLTGSSLAFDRSVVGGQEFGVSGLLYQNNLVMWNRTAEESLWPQMFAEAKCGPAGGTVIPQVAALEATWEGWQALYPSTVVVSEVGIDLDRDYTFNPYRSYESDPRFLHEAEMPPIDGRRPPKERVLGVPGTSGGGVALPFGELTEEGTWAALEFEVDGEPVVVFWDGRWEAAMAYRPFVDGRRVTFTTNEFGVADVETGSRWGVHGAALFGTLSGARLEPIEEAFVAYWGAWAAFFPNTELWAAS